MFAEGIVEGCYLVNNQQKIAKQGKEKRKRKRRSSRPRILKRSRKEYTWALHWPETQRRLWRNKPGLVGLISSQCLADQSVRDLDSRVLKKKLTMVTRVEEREVSCTFLLYGSYGSRKLPNKSQKGTRDLETNLRLCHGGWWW